MVVSINCLVDTTLDQKIFSMKKMKKILNYETTVTIKQICLYVAVYYSKTIQVIKGIYILAGYLNKLVLPLLLIKHGSLTEKWQSETLDDHWHRYMNTTTEPVSVLLCRFQNLLTRGSGSTLI